MDQLGWLAITALLAHWTVVIVFSVRVIMRRRPVGVLLAWIALIFSIPVVGIALYLFVGENRVSRIYLRRGQAIQTQYQQWKESLVRHSSKVSPAAGAAGVLMQQAHSLVGFPPMAGNRLSLLTDYERIFSALIEDISAARSSCHLEFYIWQSGGLVDRLETALIEAVRRGVSARVLIDAVGSKPFVKCGGVNRLRATGIEVACALPVSAFSALFSRADLRNHRKIAVIDGEIAYTGSQNLVDPRCFKQAAGVGQWVDAMLRIEGPVVEALAGTFIQDWEVNNGIEYEYFSGRDDLRSVASRGTHPAQVVTSGPEPKPLAILQLVLSTIYAARRELIITTPYFVPDESILTALKSAAHGGVEVTLILPAKNDSLLVDYAGRAVFDDLLDAGIRIAEFRGGLLHTKSITVDGEFCLFGSVNMDMRSLWLNFELSVLVYSREMTEEIRALQLTYLLQSTELDAQRFRQRALLRRFAENTVHLLAPIL
jgi:cardiolipin synthase